MKIECKCHGVSGSCELKTCWRSMPSFRQIGDILKEKFESATEVQLKVPPNAKPVTKPVAKEPKLEAASMTYHDMPFPSKSGSRPYLVPISPYFKPQTDTDLIYLQSSPDFCEKNDKIGSLGTHGRACNRTSNAIDGCELMCCGRGYKIRRERVMERCNCKFHWCCYVECDHCSKEVEISTCL
ncbi:unnamed protein product [Oppiella nova]|uniref:Protein Wnt n=1 Tax=Oppiella nova TaxID=334625 RepID=A0A7R9QX60_9ACAR|nr:unnamed protein product [Oppiella nova]CAG2177284.1 unnamed protein product [Oppiella nova]